MNTYSDKEQEVLNRISSVNPKCPIPIKVLYDELSLDPELIGRSGFSGVISSLERKGILESNSVGGTRSVTSFKVAKATQVSPPAEKAQEDAPVAAVKESKAKEKTKKTEPKKEAQKVEERAPEKKPKREKKLKAKRTTKRRTKAPAVSSRDIALDVQGVVRVNRYHGMRFLTWKTRKFAERHMVDGEHARPVDITSFDRSGGEIGTERLYMIFRWNGAVLEALSYISTKRSRMAVGDTRIFVPMEAGSYDLTPGEKNKVIDARIAALDVLVQEKREELKKLEAELNELVKQAATQDTPVEQ